MLGEATAEERQQVERWMADDANLAYFSQLKKIWEESRQLASTTTADENKSWEKFRQRIHPAPVRRVGVGWIKIAASIVIVGALGLIAYLGLSGRANLKVVVAQQTVLTDTLPDGSFVTVNKGSSISYPSRFNGDTRQVVLNGEAFFNVTPNKKKPFVISVNDITITVVGTSFNVKNINGNTEVVVETGIVKVTRAGKTIELNANEELHLNAKDSMLSKEKVSDHLYNYYRTKEFVCDDTPLWKVVEKINEAYHSHIVFGDSSLREMPLTVTFNNESLDQVLNVISETFNIKVIKEGDSIILQQ